MILELDAGNTRIKWRVRERNKQGDWQKIAEGSVFAREKTPSVFIELGKQLEKQPMDQIARMLVASVRGKGFRAVFSSLMTEKWHLQPEFATVADHCAGVQNGYTDTALLGVDRWLAMVAAHARASGACCVVDCGTTITVDLVNDQGRHLGGYIVPGLHVMRDALAARSKALNTAAAEWREAIPGTSTQAAVYNGILAMALGFLRDIRRQAADNGGQWFLTGGDAGVVAPHLDWPCTQVPDLVMDGLVPAMLPAVAGN